MSEKNLSRREMLTLEAIDPSDGKPCGILVSFDRMQHVAKRGMGHANEAAYLLPETLQKPTAIFEGLRRESDEDMRGCGWRCYCGVPTRSFRPDGSEGPPYRNQVYLVFVNDQHVAYNWRWEKADGSNPKLPIGHEFRFKTRLL